jgi:TolB protein
MLKHDERMTMSVKSLRLGLVTIQAMLMFVIDCTIFETSATRLFAQKTSRIAFIKERDVYVMDADGDNVRQLTSFGSDKSATQPAWSPDDEEIVFTVTSGDSAAQLWVMNSDGTHQRVLVSDRFFSNAAASFSPDGQTIVFARCLPQESAVPECAIYRVQTDGSRLSDVTEYQSAVRDFSPVYSPDGKTLAFESYNRQGVAGAIYLMGADGSNVRRLTPSDLGAHTPSWSPDGSKIAFSSNCCSGKNSDIWTIGSDGLGLTRVTAGCGRNCNPWDYLNSFPSWSPDGRSIAFAQAMDTPNRGIWIVMEPKQTIRGSRRLILPGAIQPRWSHAQ